MRLDTIEAATADGVLRSIIISKGLDSPRALALDPSSGYVKEHERLKELIKKIALYQTIIQSRQTFTRSRSRNKTEKGVKYVQS